MSNLISLKLFGTIATDFGGKTLSQEISSADYTLKDLLLDLKKLNEGQFPSYFDEDYSPKRGTLILINGVDFNTLDGLDSKLIPSIKFQLFLQLVVVNGKLFSFSICH